MEYVKKMELEEAENRERLIPERTSKGEELIQIKINPNKPQFDFVISSPEGCENWN
jgi:hypothetical protein